MAKKPAPKKRASRKHASRRPPESEIVDVQEEIFALKEKLSGLRRKVRPSRVEDYALRDHDGKPLSLAAAFGKKKDLLVVHNMGKKCPYCTLWADEMNGVLAHIQNRTAFLVTSPDDPKTQRAFRKSRGWKFRMASVAGTAFARDMGFEPRSGVYWPGVTSFRKAGGNKIERVTSAFFGPGDDFCAVWSYFDLLDGGAGGWQPRFRYPRER
ncbi:MAG: DUF899 family protein [Planctomycetes bacterium]|nr:DUF899 family protein [Planctomycetota bacterium]